MSEGNKEIKPKALPCPFCGGPAVNVACEYYQCGAPYNLDGKCPGIGAKAYTLELWNTRAVELDMIAPALKSVIAFLKGYEGKRVKDGFDPFGYQIGKLQCALSKLPTEMDSAEQIGEAKRSRQKTGQNTRDIDDDDSWVHDNDMESR